MKKIAFLLAALLATVLALARLLAVVLSRADWALMAEPAMSNILKRPMISDLR